MTCLDNHFFEIASKVGAISWISTIVLEVKVGMCVIMTGKTKILFSSLQNQLWTSTTLLIYGLIKVPVVRTAWLVKITTSYKQNVFCVSVFYTIAEELYDGWNLGVCAGIAFISQYTQSKVHDNLTKWWWCYQTRQRLCNIIILRIGEKQHQQKTNKKTTTSKLLSLSTFATFSLYYASNMLLFFKKLA